MAENEQFTKGNVSPRHSRYQKWLEYEDNNWMESAPPIDRVPSSSTDEEEDTILLPTQSKESELLICEGEPSLDAIKKDLKEHTPYDSRYLDGIGERLEQVELKLRSCSSLFFSNEKKKEKPTKTFMTELNEELLASRRLKELEMIKEKARILQFGSSSDDKDSNAVENGVFSGLDEGGVVGAIPLPGKLEALAVLNLVTKAPAAIKKAWKKLFFSNLSVCILQNTFWWIWMDYFKPDKEIQAVLFDQIADDFAMLINEMDNSTSADKAFVCYPTHLAQALYSTFCQAFPNSLDKFNSTSFLDYLCNTMSEWVKGVKSVPGEWKSWPRHLLCPTANPTPVDTKEELLRTRSSRSVITPHNDIGRSRGTSKLPQLQTFSNNDQEDTDTTFERVQFSMIGCSPLLVHSLHRHHIKDDRPTQKHTVTRTQIKSITQNTTRTSQEKLLREADELYKEYESEIAQTSRSVAASRSEVIKELRKMERKNKAVLMQRHEVLLMAEKLLMASKKEDP